MNREILLRQLVRAEQDVAQGKVFIAKQQRLIVDSERDGCHDTAGTMRLLEAFYCSSDREEDRARILDELLSKGPTTMYFTLPSAGSQSSFAA